MFNFFNSFGLSSGTIRTLRERFSAGISKLSSPSPEEQTDEKIEKM